MSADNPAGKVIVLRGEVIAKSEAGSRILQLDDPVFPGDTIITEEGERLEVLFNDGTRLSQGQKSHLQIDDFIYDGDNSSILLDALQGTFRTITGKIAEENPENFIIQTPLATLGIRGTTVLSQIQPEYEIHGPEYLDSGKVFVLTDKMGNTRFITDHFPVKVIDLHPEQPAGFQRMLTPGEMKHFNHQTPFSDNLPDDDSTDNEIEGDPFSSESQGLSAKDPAGHLFGPKGNQLHNFHSGKFGPSRYANSDGLSREETSGFRKPLSSDEPPGQNDPEEPVIIPPPEAEDITAMLVEDGVYHGYLPGNDYGKTLSFMTDLNGRFNAAGVAYEIISKPQHGTLIINPDGSYTYTPEMDYNGNDSFVYQINDNQGGFSTGTVQFTITSINDIPVAGDSGLSTPGNTPLNGQLEVTDPDSGDTLTYDLLSGPVNGTVVINADGSYTYTPDQWFAGQDTFSYSVTDSHGTTDTGSITVDVAPGGLLMTGSGIVDILTGTSFGDEIWGMANNDTLSGAGGDDLIIGGDGIDNLTGGTGVDTFRYLNAASSLEGNDIITDFQSGIDQMLLEGISGTPVVAISGSGFLNLATARIIIFHNLTASASNYSVWYDSPGITASPHQIADLGNTPIVVGDIVIG